MLIPARNEQENIVRCIQSILSQDYPILEIVILDDQSEDKTAEIVAEITRDHPNMYCLTGKALPKGWLGKNWACWQLAQKAKGEILLFVDADTWHENSAVTATIYWMNKYQLSMLSAFPQQITRSFAEKIIVPLIDIILYMLLPLWAVYKFSFTALSAANGQWLAIEKNAYQQIGGHHHLKNRVVEDVEMARLSKRKGLKIMTTSGTGMVFCHMYHRFSDIWAGLSKNFYGLTGNNIVVLLMILVILSIVFILPFVVVTINIGSFWLWIDLILMFFLRTLLAIAYRHNLVISIIFFPITIILGMIISVNSFYQSRYGSIYWKGRKIKIM